MKTLLTGYEDLICRPDDVEDLAFKILKALHYRKVNYREKLKTMTWEKLGIKLEEALKLSISSKRSS